jgi:glucosamine-6-phosphate deaminase
VAPEITVVPTAEAAGELVAARIAERLAASDAPFLLGCPAGRTPSSTYAALSRLELDRARLVVVMMDEFVVPSSGGMRLADPVAHFSCRRFAEDHLLPILDGDRSRLWSPALEDPAAYDARIADAGGIDLFLLASGASDGHVAFNPPGTALDSCTHVVRLADSTRRDNLGTFPAFGSIDDVPTHGVTVGLGTIAGSREVILLLLGAEKATSFALVRDADGFDPSWPATVVHACASASIVVDAAAARTA